MFASLATVHYLGGLEHGRQTKITSSYYCVLRCETQPLVWYAAPPPLQAYRSPQTKEARGAAEESARQKALSALGDNGYESAALYRAFKTVQSKAMRQVGLKEGALLFLMTRPLACLDCVSIWSSGDLEHC